MKIDLDDKTNVLIYHKKLLAEDEKEKEEFKTKTKHFQSSSKGLSKLLNCQMSAKENLGLECSRVNDIFVKVEGMHVVPPSMTGNYMPSTSNFGTDESKFTYGPKQSTTSESDAKTSDLDSCESSSSKESLETVPKLVESKPKVVNEPNVWTNAPIIEEYESDSDDKHVTIPSKEQKKPCFAFVNTVEHVKTPRQTAKEQNTCSQNPKPSKRDYNGLMSKKLGLGYGFTKKACFVCGNFSDLIRDCDFHEKKMAKQVELNKDYQDFNGGPVTFAGSKGQITVTECLVLSSNFKLPYENQVLLRVSRQHNMYSFNLENNVSSRGLACLIAKARIDKSTKWHRRSKGIKREYSNARTPQQNGVAERKNRTLIEAARTMLADSFLPYTFWLKQLVLLVMSLIGYHVTILNTIDHLGKFEEKSDEEFLVGYSLSSKDFRVYNLETKRVEETLHKNFLENKPNVAGKGPTWLFDLDYLTDSLNYQPITVENKANKTTGLKETNNSVGIQDSFDARNSKIEADHAQEYYVLSLWSSYTSTVKSSKAKNGDEKLNEDTDSKTTEEPVDQKDQAFLEELERLQRQEKEANDADKTLRKTFSQSTKDFFFKQELLEPTDIYDVSKDGIFTSASYNDEGAVADLTNLEKTVNALKDESWVDAMNKNDERGVVVRNKVRLVAQGHRQEEGIDCDEVFAPVAKIEAVYKVVKALYGLHQAPRAWYATLSTFLVQSGYRRGLIDKTLFIKKDKKNIMLVQVYVDDIIFCSTKKSWCDEFEALMKNSVKTACTPIETKKPLVKNKEAANVDKKHNPKRKHTQESEFPPTKSPVEQNLPSPSNNPLLSGEDSLKLKELMDLSTNLSNKVLKFESEVIDIKFTYQERIEKLEGRVERLEEENKVLKELKSVHSTDDANEPVMTNEKSSKQGRKIEDIDADVKINLEKAQVEAYNLDLDYQEKVVSMMDVNEEEPADVEEVLEVVKAAKLMIEVVTTTGATKVSVPRKRRGVIIQDPEETTTTATVQPKNYMIKQVKRNERLNDAVMKYETLKRKPLPQAQARRNMIVYLKNIVGFKMDYFKRMTYDEIIPLFEKHYNFNQIFLDEVNKGVKVSETEPNVEAGVWKYQKGRYGLAKVKSWKLIESCGVHCITFSTTQIFLLVERMYPLTHFTLEQILNNVRLQVEDESEMSLELLRLTPSLSFMRPFGCPVTILNTLDPLGNQSNGSVGKAGVETVPDKDYILLPLWTQDPLFFSSSKDSPSNEFKPSEEEEKKDTEDLRNEDNKVLNENIVYGCADDPNMPNLEEIVYSDEDEDVGAEADMTNLDTNILVTPISTTRIHKDHPVEQIIGDILSALQTRSMAKNVTNHEPKKQVWTMDLPYGKRAIETKWIYRNKKDERGIVVRNKERLVGQGYTQEGGIDYDEVFAPVARIEVIRLFLAYASFKDFVVYQMDVKSSFLDGKIKDKVYVCQPLGFEDPEFPDRVYKVEKALYDLHQALRAWKEMCTEFEKMMHKKFQMSSMGEFTFFLGLQVTEKYDGIFISQDKYVDEILKKFGFSTVKTTSKPMETSKPLMKDKNTEDVDIHLYRSLISSLIYLISSRPDIMFVDSPFKLEAYTDSDYAGANLDKKFTTGGCQFLGSRLNSWQCKKQTVVANSTTEAELPLKLQLLRIYSVYKKETLRIADNADFAEIVDFLNANPISINITTAEPVTTISTSITTACVSVSIAEPTTPPPTSTTVMEDEEL
nr:hypothetical protein [Tanacetum cinerariifolium]